MPQLNNYDIIGHILKSVIDIISRRTSEGYAIVVTGLAIKDLGEKYSFLRYVEIKSSRYSEDTNIIDIKPDINYVNPNEIGKAMKEFVQKLVISMGKNAGFYFIKEIKEGLPYDYELTMKNIGVDLDFIQLEYITDKKDTHKLQIENSEALKHVLKTLFYLLDSDNGRNFAFSTMNDLIKRFSKEYETIKYVKINDTRFIQDADIISVTKDVNSMEPSKVGNTIQRIIQEVNDSMKEKGDFSFIEKLRSHLAEDYILRLKEMGVDLQLIQQLHQDLVVKHVLKALVDVLSETSNQRYAVSIVDNVLRKINGEYNYLKSVKIDTTKYPWDLDAISVSSDIDSIKTSELGKAIQKIIENVINSLDRETSQNFVDKFREHLERTYLRRIEEMGVNLHMIQLRQSLLW